ncbi:MRN complex-interacting protein isoform X2 [Cryptotermes secundus]|nr:MRN complex-interacting protein isoform X2 [Cryptotermes secundus]
MCGEKQSIKKVYGRGSGKDCRLHVQHLNEMRMKQERHGCQKFPFQEECSEDPASVHCVLEEQPIYNSGESHFVTPHCSKWSRYLDKQDLEESDAADTHSSAILASQLITETVTNASQISNKQDSALKRQIFYSPILNSSEKEAVFCNDRTNIFHTNMEPTSDHQDKDICQSSTKQRNFSCIKRKENYYPSDEENQPDELWNRQYVRNPSLEVQQDSCNSFGGDSELVELPINRNTYPALQHGPVHCNSVSTCMNSQDVFLCEPILLDSEDELDNILSF